MNNEIMFSHLRGEFESHSWPATRSRLATMHADTTVLFADGETDLGALIASTQPERFESPDDLMAALQNVVPIEAVGEPGQSDGDA